LVSKPATLHHECIRDYRDFKVKRLK
jgi:hypothetical protein